jgi:hypothetical protein
MWICCGLSLLAASIVAPRPAVRAQASPGAVLVDVRRFGAIPDDGKDDADAIQNAIDAARSGQTVIFPAGVFEISKTLNPRGGGRTIQGATQLTWQADRIVATSQTILKATGENFVFYLQGSNLALRNLSFQGRALACDRPNNLMNSGVVIDNCWFSLNVKGDRQDAIEFSTGLADSKITNCVFDPIAGDNGIYGYNWNNLTIANNLFLNGNEGIHLIAHSDASKDLLIEQNYCAGLSRMGMEIQGGGLNTVVQDNWYEKPRMSAKSGDNDATFAYSIVSDRSRGTRIRRNVSIAPERPDGVGVRIVFELGGSDFLCEDNYSDGGNHVIAVNGAKASGIARNNLLKGYLEAPRNSNDARGVFSNNGADVKLKIDLVTRGRPGPNRRFSTLSEASHPGG